MTFYHILPTRDSDSVSKINELAHYRRYLFFILGRRPRSLSDSDKEAALYLAADNNYPLNER